MTLTRTVNQLLGGGLTVFCGDDQKLLTDAEIGSDRAVRVSDGNFHSGYPFCTENL